MHIKDTTVHVSVQWIMEMRITKITQHALKMSDTVFRVFKLDTIRKEIDFDVSYRTEGNVLQSWRGCSV